MFSSALQAKTSPISKAGADVTEILLIKIMKNTVPCSDKMEITKVFKLVIARNSAKLD